MATYIEKQVIEAQHIHQDVPDWVKIRLERIERKLDEVPDWVKMHLDRIDRKLDHLTKTLDGFIAGNLSPENQRKVDLIMAKVEANTDKVAEITSEPKEGA